MLKILAADDHALMRQGISIVLENIDTDLQILSATNYKETLQYLNEASDIDLVILDLNMPGEEPFTGLKSVLTAANIVPIVVLSASETPADMQQSIGMGAKGFIPKSSSNQVLVAALKLVLSGGVYIPPQLFNFVPDNIHVTRIQPDEGQVSITRRQKEVLELVALGKSNKDIGRVLGLSDGTVRTHVNAIFKLLGVNNRTQAGVKARTLGLL